MGSLNPKMRIVDFDAVGSTQTKAAELAEDGASQWTVVVASSQSEGRGRRGRGWSSPPGGLYMSVVLRPRSTETLAPLSLAMSFAVAEAVKKLTKLPVSIRWPNDLMIRGRKFGGVISESRFAGDELSFAIVGVGVNCNSVPALVDGDNQPTGIRKESGKQVDVAGLRGAILSSFASIYADLERRKDVVRQLSHLVFTPGKMVAITLKTGETISYKAVGLSRDGELQVLRGRKRSVLRVEDVETLREPD